MNLEEEGRWGNQLEWEVSVLSLLISTTASKKGGTLLALVKLYG